jgi:exosortase
MIPLPYILYDSVAFPLKLLVSKFSVDFLTLIGVLALREGNIIHLVNTTLEVADACSGIRSIISLLALSTALAYFTQDGWIKKLVLVALAVPIAILVNSLRVIGTGILADKYGVEAAEGFFHEFAGLMIFGVAIVMLVLSAIVLGKIKR